MIKCPVLNFPVMTPLYKQQLLLRQDLIFVDLETTGFNPDSDRIIEVGVVRIRDGEIVDQFNSLVNPEMQIGAHIKAITGIKSHQLIKAPTFREIIPRMMQILNNGIFVAHNVDFDYGFVEAEFDRHEHSFTAPRLCTVKLSRELYPDYMSHNLDSISKRFNIQIDDRHRAMDDAVATWKFFEISKHRLGVKQVNQALVKLLKEAKPRRVTAATTAQMSLL